MDTDLEVLEQLLSLDYNQRIYAADIKYSSKKVFENNPARTEKIELCSTDSERIKVAKDGFVWAPLDPEIKEKYKKNSVFANKFRNLGNAAFQKARYLDALRLYNFAILFAPPADPELGLAYANRSAALNSLDHTDEALKDIDLALSNGYPDEVDMRKKLEDRKLRFKSKIRDRRKSPGFEKQFKDELSCRNQFYKEVFTLKNPNKLAPAMEDSVDIKWNSTRGRHLVANRNIPIGTTVLVEKPFAAYLTKACNNWDVDHCHHCLKKNFQCIPCHICVFTQYCNEKCREAAQIYHQYECPCLPELSCISQSLEKGATFHMHLAFKLICTLGPYELFRMFKERKHKDVKNAAFSKSKKPGPGPVPAQGDSETKTVTETESKSSTHPTIAGTDPETGIYNPASYHASYNLMANTSSEDKITFFMIVALTLSRNLDANSEFFDFLFEETAAVAGCSTNMKNVRENPRLNLNTKAALQDFIAELILHHWESFATNAFGLPEFPDMDGVSLRSYLKSASKPHDTVTKKVDKIAGCFATICLMNHSCAPNVERFPGNSHGVMAIVALKPLKPGEELLVSYGPVYGYGDDDGQKTTTRQIELRQSYLFQCGCIACKNDWPGKGELVELVKKQLIFCCPVCAVRFPHESKMSPEFLKCALGGGSGSGGDGSDPNYKCKLCKRQYPKLKLTKEYDTQMIKLHNIQDNLIDKKHPSALEAISILEDIQAALQYFETSLCQPNYHCVLASRLYNVVVNLILLYSQSNDSYDYDLNFWRKAKVYEAV